MIIVDELDRCRPTYAIKLLEEIKHLFDVPGIAFIFGMHGEQLAESIRAAYGPKFDGKAYLRRFVSRRYKLKRPDLQRLLSKLLSDAGITTKQLIPYFRSRAAGFDEGNVALDVLLSRYMQIYCLPAREAFHVVDMLQTSIALAGGELYAPYLVPLLMSRLKGAEQLLAPPAEDPNWHLVVYDHRTNTSQDTSPGQVAQNIDKLMRLSLRDLSERFNSEGHDIFVEIVGHMRNGKSGLSDPQNYPQLLDAVGRFSIGQQGAG